jgi:sigma-E factor negative regulatory protein RseA
MENAQHLLTSVKAGGDSAECWRTYHLIGDAMRGNAVYKPDLTQKIMQQIDLEPTVLAPQHKKSPIKQVYWSVAASVAAVMFVSWMVMQQQSPSNNALAPIEIAQNLPAEYLVAHQSSAPSGVAFYIQPASYTTSVQGGR